MPCGVPPTNRKGDVMILKCGCRTDKKGIVTAADYQNHEYGYGYRVCNPSQKPIRERPRPKCTVCGKRVV